MEISREQAIVLLALEKAGFANDCHPVNFDQVAQHWFDACVELGCVDLAVSPKGFGTSLYYDRWEHTEEMLRHLDDLGLVVSERTYSPIRGKIANNQIFEKWEEMRKKKANAAKTPQWPL